MRNVYLVCYDVADDKRLRKTYKKMCGFGDPVQYSVFRCELSPTEKQLMKEALWAMLNWDAGPCDADRPGAGGARGDECIEFWGDPRVELPRRAAVIV